MQTGWGLVTKDFVSQNVRAEEDAHLLQPLPALLEGLSWVGQLGKARNKLGQKPAM